MKDLSDRMKRYEEPFSQVLLPRTPAILRLDGRSFHTLTKILKCKKPFDEFFINTMKETAYAVCQQVQGFEFCYVASDEISILFHDLQHLNSEQWFGGKINKINSVASSIATDMFNRRYSLLSLYPHATFDCRVFSIPVEDIPNYFIWRQKDWCRNSLNMFAQSFFSHKEMLNKHSSDLHEMLYEKGENWTNLSPHLKNGIAISKYFNKSLNTSGLLVEWDLPVYDYYKFSSRLSFNQTEN